MSVFGALNRLISRLDDGPPQQARSKGDGTFGFQVLRNKSKEVPLEPWFDFIVGINGRQIDNSDPHLFSTEVRNCSGSTVALTCWNAKGQRVRDLHLPVPSPSPTLGLTLQWTPLTLTQSIWHILDVAPDSPADLAGLLPYGDYIIGSPEGLLRGESGFGELVEDYSGRPLRLYVYNHEYSVTRLLTITPSRSWGGEGALGCVLGYGALHQLPAPLEEPPTGEGETMFETARLSKGERPPGTDYNDQPSLGDLATSPPQGDDGFQAVPADAPTFITPASMSIQASPLETATGATSRAPVAGGPPAKKSRVSKVAGFDDMFAEGEKKSQELDNAPKTKSGGLPPPPKRADATSPASTTQEVPPSQMRKADPVTAEEEEEEEEE